MNTPLSDVLDHIAELSRALDDKTLTFSDIRIIRQALKDQDKALEDLMLSIAGRDGDY